jgi:SAM-dependent methyltransferase
VDENTKHRDVWLQSKTVALSQVFEATTKTAEQVRRGTLALDKLIQDAARATTLRDFYSVIEELAKISRDISYNAHSLKAFCDFQIPPATVFTDHYINQFFLLSALKRTWWIEGAVFCGLAIKPGSRILELGCGTGYYSDIFFSPFASEVVAIDIDQRAIETARRFHQATNIRYEVMDFTKTLPDGPFDLVAWSPTIAAYTVQDVHELMTRLREIMSKDALLYGWTAVETDRSGPEILWYDMKSLAKRLQAYFNNVRAFERVHTTVQPPRHELYFYASDGLLPFDSGWPHNVRLSTCSLSAAAQKTGHTSAP